MKEDLLNIDVDEEDDDENYPAIARLIELGRQKNIRHYRRYTRIIPGCRTRCRTT